MTTEPTPLGPLGPTDSYAYANGVIAYYAPGYIFIHASANDEGIKIPRSYYGVIRAVALSMGLSSDEASLLCEAAETHARPTTDVGGWLTLPLDEVQ